MNTFEKKYKEALKQAQKELATCGSMDCDAARQIFRLFPQLRESEDERTRKYLIEWVSISDNPRKKECLSWLEKQKEQKPADLSDMMVHKEPYIAPVPTPMVADEQKHADEQFPPLEGLDAIKAKYYDDGFKNGFDEGIESVKPAWSEEDEDMLEYIIGDVNDAKQLYTTQEAKDMADKEIAWLKSLRPSWKPSEEQMGAFKGYIEDFQERAEAAVGGWNNFDVMIRLYEQLKKL